MSDPGSSSGRKTGFEPVNLGSNPSPGANSRATTLDKILLADAKDQGMRQLQDRIEVLEKAIDLHQQEITFAGHAEGRDADKKLWEAKGENWSDDYE